MRRIFNLFRWRRWRLEQDLDRELRYHVDRRVQDLMEVGVGHDEARRRAAIELGGHVQIREEVRDTWIWRWLDDGGRDVGYGMRQVRRNPAFSAIAIATLALGIGGITAIFSAFDTILIRPLPYADADRLVMVWDDMSKSEGDSRFVSTPAEWIEWRRLNTVFTDLACSQPGRRHSVGRRRTRGGPGAESDVESVERSWRAAGAWTRLHRG